VRKPRKGEDAATESMTACVGFATVGGQVRACTVRADGVEVAGWANGRGRSESFIFPFLIIIIHIHNHLNYATKPLRNMNFGLICLVLKIGVNLQRCVKSMSIIARAKMFFHMRVGIVEASKYNRVCWSL
jgi:hypothetical protein